MKLRIKVAKIQRRNWQKRYPDDWKSLSQSIKAKHNNRCSKCGCVGSFDNPIQLHHLIPLSRGGRNVQANFVPLCSICHRRSHRGKQF